MDKSPKSVNTYQRRLRTQLNNLRHTHVFGTNSAFLSSEHSGQFSGCWVQILKHPKQWSYRGGYNLLATGTLWRCWCLVLCHRGQSICPYSCTYFRRNLDKGLITSFVLMNIDNKNIVSSRSVCMSYMSTFMASEYNNVNTFLLYIGSHYLI